MDFVIINDKASYVAKEDGISLFMGCQRSDLERTMNKTLRPFRMG